MTNDLISTKLGKAVEFFSTVGASLRVLRAKGEASLLSTTRQAEREDSSSAQRARRLRLEYDRLRRRLMAAEVRDAPQDEAVTARRHVERIARELRLIRADSVHAVESKLRVLLGLTGETLDETAHKLLSSALADLHYLALMSQSRAG